MYCSATVAPMLGDVIRAAFGSISLLKALTLISIPSPRRQQNREEYPIKVHSSPGSDCRASTLVVTLFPAAPSIAGDAATLMEAFKKLRRLSWSVFKAEVFWGTVICPAGLECGWHIGQTIRKNNTSGESLKSQLLPD